jgi:hypothetical protein
MNETARNENILEFKIPTTGAAKTRNVPIVVEFYILAWYVDQNSLTRTASGFFDGTER